MLKRFIDIRTSLTARIFLMTIVILLISSSVTYLFLAWATPISYRSIIADNLNEKVDRLISDLAETTFEESGPLISRFEKENNAEIRITAGDGETSLLPGNAPEEEAVDSVIIEDDGSSVSTCRSTATAVVSDSSEVEYTSTDWDAAVTFKGSGKPYDLSVVIRVSAVNETSEAMRRVLPCLILIMFVISLLGALFYSRCITRPIVRLSGISRKLASLDFDWKCPETRKDEIGMLGRNLNELSDHLRDALSELRDANASLQQDIEREREMERRRSAFFAAASHELKTPITVLKGQLSGMLAGVDIYQDRDKYLARSLAVTGRMEKLIQEMLTIFRMEQDDSAVRSDPVSLTELIQEQLDLAEDFAQLKEQQISVSLPPKAVIQGDRVLLSCAISNLLTNALKYSPDAALISVTLSERDTGLILDIENSGVHIPPESLPRLFEPFYRVEASRSRETGGSGLGLYLARMILDRQEAACTVMNTGIGVRVTVKFSCQKDDSLHENYT